MKHMKRADSTLEKIPNEINIFSNAGERVGVFNLRPDLHNERPAWDMKGSLHHSLCWTPFENGAKYGFWSVANLWTRDEFGQATGVVFETPESPIGDGPTGMPLTATASNVPPLGWWTRGRPWVGDRTSGGRQMQLAI
jgi:hypothetical protein